MSPPLTGCRWPIGVGEGASSVFAFCGEPCEGPFCAQHANVFVHPTDNVDVAIQRGLLVSVKLERYLLMLEEAAEGIWLIGGMKGLEAATASAIERIRQRPPKPGEGAR